MSSSSKHSQPNTCARTSTTSFSNYLQSNALTSVLCMSVTAYLWLLDNGYVLSFFGSESVRLTDVQLQCQILRARTSWLRTEGMYEPTNSQFQWYCRGLLPVTYGALLTSKIVVKFQYSPDVTHKRFHGQKKRNGCSFLGFYGRNAGSIFQRWLQLLKFFGRK